MDNVSAVNKLARLYMATGFAYLLVGSVLLALQVVGAIGFERDAIFMMELYGFVAMLIFGLSYVFAPGLSHTSHANYKIIIAEFVALNAGIILFVAAASGMLQKPLARTLAVPGLALLLCAITIHAVNMWKIIAVNRRLTPPGAQPQR